VKNDYGTEYEARALNGLEEPLKKIHEYYIRGGRVNFVMETIPKPL
jgi:hypothetical protein